MATKTDAKERLIRLLERRAWNPVLKASPKGRDKADVKRLERVQKKTGTQRDRYWHYRSAGEVLKRFKGDLSSAAAKKTNADLHTLGLPTQADIADEFQALADRLKVEPQKGGTKPHKPHPPHPWHKSKPQDRKRAAAELKREARSGNRAALKTMKKAPAKWARDYAQQLTAKKRASKKRA